MNKDKIWQLLFDAIKQNKVMPIIGDEFFYAEINGQRIPYNQFLINKLLEKFPIPQGYNEGIEEHISPDFNMIADAIRISNIINSQMYGMMEKSTNIYYEINAIIESNPIICDERLVEFLNRINFPLILTTSFLPGIENALKKYKANLTIKSYDKSPRLDWQENDKDTIYYLFGRSNKLNKGYMVTEDDLLDYMHYWHNLESRPKELSNLLSSKFLLVLGCDYPNWLFRFFWHSIKNFNLLTNSDGTNGVVAGSILETDYELARFLSRIQTHAFGDCGKVLDTILSMLPEKCETVAPSVLPHQESDNHDIFISYAHENADIAQIIANIFEKYGAKVWFDSSALVGSDLYDGIIQRTIEGCERFVPIMSEYTENAKRGYFRKEWSLAIDELKFRLGSPYISPIIIDNADINSPRFPKEFRDAHILNFRDADFENAVKKLIRSFR